jgi:hypothetical protein|tara:strand:+ start:491 stop:670 length:180 start_codon:yes stop_codon:yes gene_type:complete
MKKEMKYDGCQDCGVVYSMFFHTQYHKPNCKKVKNEQIQISKNQVKKRRNTAPNDLLNG